MTKDLKPATIAAHAAGAIDRQSAGVVPPIQSSTTFLRDENYDLIRPDNIYLRDDNDNMRLAEEVIRQLEGAAETLLFPSGMAAIAAAFRPLRAGATIVIQSDIYYGSKKWITEFCERRDITCHQVDTSDTDAMVAACAAWKPAILFIETPSNPLLKTIDIAAGATAVRANGGLLVIDATAATPILMQPLALGADIVMHSGSKAINGHSDILAGVLSARETAQDHWQAVKKDRHDAGAIMGAFEAWLLLRAMRTMPLRVKQMTENAMGLAEHLDAHPQVETVLYPGLPAHPGHALAARQMSGFGSLMSILVKGGAAEALAIVGKLKLFLRATSLGGVESLVEHRATIEPQSGLPENLIRISVGIEDIDDLKADWDQALR
ncbi:MAG: aminotransferase class I/II-fold pyridoxal phosphate-dependent enzyme [Pseudomonadota bacterium]